MSADNPSTPIASDLSPADGPRRRRVLGGLAAGTVAAALPQRRARAATLPRVAIIGGGMAGIACAWLLDGVCEVQLYEARDTIGGNVRTLSVQVGGQVLPVDMGAQFFHPGPYPTYVQLLSQLGLWPVDSGESHSFVASITLSSPDEATPRFVSPVLPGRAWPLLAPWNRSGVQAFQTAFNAAQRREQRDASWSLSMGDWLASLNLTPAQAETMILPWAASLNSGDVSETGGLSARALMVFAAGALPPALTDPVLYYVLKRGMIEPLNRMVAQFGTVQMHISAAVEAVSPAPGGGFRVQPQGLPAADFDAVVFAASGPPTLSLLAGLPGTAAQRSALQGIPFYDATLALHTDPAFAPADPRHWSFLNCSAEGSACEASMWLDPVIGSSGLWKSWISHRAPPQQLLATEQYRHMLPTVGAIQSQKLLAAQQGRGGIWFAGGYTQPFDSQETALLSAMGVAQGLSGGSARLSRLQRLAQR